MLDVLHESREAIRQFLDLALANQPVGYAIEETVTMDGYTRHRISYRAMDGDPISTYLLLPTGDQRTKLPAVLAHHQHDGQRHLGKSEVVGIMGDPLQAFAPELAKRGIVVLAPDSTCFEDRRKHTNGTKPDDRDTMGHYREMGNRLTAGDTLMGKVLSDASVGLSLLAHHPQVDSQNIGIIGHSYGGSTVLFQAGLDTRINFAVSSGALGSYRYKREHDVGLEMSLIIPGFAAKWDIHNLLECVAPRPILILSADEDPYSADAGEVIKQCMEAGHITHLRYKGKHELTQERFDQIIQFVIDNV